MTNDERLKEIYKVLEQNGVENIPRLYVMTMATGEQLIGEVHPFNPKDDVEPGKVMVVTNPKRIIRMTSQRSGGLEINIFVGEMDLLDAGFIYVIPQMMYQIILQPEGAQLAILGLYKEFLDRKVINRAEEAGLVVPTNTITSPFKK
jgi:hypothetical protein